MKLSNETKSWLKYITIPHLLTMLLMLPAAPLWLASGVVGVFCCFPRDRTYIQLVSGCLLIFVILLIIGGFGISRHKRIGKILISLTLYFWFLAGFFSLASHY
ncbi:hypothetical protein MIS45_06725 [Wielerella bovis]|uniref:hypothetical protein n=1 Tax=Wielerella bovis TaxID=2917790 RepID=UPI0020184722|nr:hypothetical protein [Wielerella bovis]ULJ68498.1 hypothetical protein MIS45_06725 [Wielerella bovis]